MFMFATLGRPTWNMPSVQFPVVKSPLYLIEYLPSGQPLLVLWRWPIGLMSEKEKKKEYAF